MMHDQAVWRLLDDERVAGGGGERVPFERHDVEVEPCGLTPQSPRVPPAAVESLIRCVQDSGADPRIEFDVAECSWQPRRQARSACPSSSMRWIAMPLSQGQTAPLW
jgi:hypothetical protein